MASRCVNALWKALSLIRALTSRKMSISLQGSARKLSFCTRFSSFPFVKQADPVCLLKCVTDGQRGWNMNGMDHLLEGWSKNSSNFASKRFQRLEKLPNKWKLYLIMKITFGLSPFVPEIIKLHLLCHEVATS